MEPKPKLSSEFNASELQVWEEQWQTYFDVSGLQNAGIKIQKAALVNSLTTEFRTRLDLSHAPSVAAGLEMIRKDFTQRNPKVVRRHNLFRIKQRKGESFSEMRVRMKILLKEADIAYITADELVCHLMMAACTDADLLQEMMKIEEGARTEAKLDEVVDKYETLAAAARGLNKTPKGEPINRVRDESKQVICYRCQSTDGHMADKCTVPASSLKCSKCKTTGLHNTHPYCKRKNNSSKKVDAKEDKKQEKKEEESGKRVVGRDDSPAGTSNETSDENMARADKSLQKKPNQRKCQKKRRNQRPKPSRKTKKQVPQKISLTELQNHPASRQIQVLQRSSSTTHRQSFPASRPEIPFFSTTVSHYTESNFQVKILFRLD